MMESRRWRGYVRQVRLCIVGFQRDTPGLLQGVRTLQPRLSSYLLSPFIETETNRFVCFLAIRKELK